ncbi:hypothetical protein Tco_0910351 [Tanacetum coccineum]|uniref:Uncharacterized protein n=1 Tax=Tanacetum coccineum TaxID=301880 RepID=A0ABQ5CVX3_9ASTR
MESACIYDQNTVIKELTQGIQMAKELRCNLNSPVARDFLIQKILSTNENTLLVLKSGESARQATALPVIKLSSPEREKGPLFEEAINGKPKHVCYNDTQSATTLQPSPSPERHEIKPTTYYLSESMFSDTLSNLKTNLNVNTYDLNVLSPTLISPDTSGSHNITDWDSSPSFDFTVDQDDSDHYFKLQIIDELTQGIQMAKELRFNLNSPQARDFLIQKIFSSYENALFILKSGESADQPMAAALPAPSLPESTTSTGSTIVEKAFRGKHTCYYGAQSAEPLPLPPPPLPLKGETILTHYNYHLSQPNPGEMLSNLKTNLSVNTYDLCGPTVPSLCSFASSQFGFMEEYQQLQFLITSEDEVLQVYSPPFISPDTSESNYFSEWDSNSSPSLDFTVDQDDSDNYFTVNNSFF